MEIFMGLPVNWMSMSIIGLYKVMVVPIPVLMVMALILKKIICTENFEKYATNGGQLLKQAAAMPQEGYKGGVGAYRFDNDYDNTPNYKWMRQAIQINQRVFNEWKAKQNEAENKPQK